ncbi:MAG: hypothetical protein GWM88_10470 [Pseudomonadales bacterium]|nr:nuclear transport factor 2 family protein [Pseudomonadales bacterium]NIX08391.1 hypothetical protein [Pseudomonadales bacterium]
MDKQMVTDIQRDCEALSMAYARAIDFRDYDHFVSLFTDDAVLDLGRPLHGREEIHAAVVARPDELQSRHVITNVFVDVIDEDTARGIAYLTLYRHLADKPSIPGPGNEPAAATIPAAVGHYQDRFARTPEGWQFTARTLHLAFRDPAVF